MYPRKEPAACLVILLAFLALGGCTDPSEIPPTSQDGILDLQEYDLLAQDYLRLDGDWSFVWGGFISPKNINQEPRDTVLMVPGAWNNLRIGGEPLPGEGVGTYHLKILLPQQVLGKPLLLRTGAVRMAYTMFLNQDTILSCGSIELPDFAPYVVPKSYSFTPTTTELDLVVYVANQGYSHGGIVNSIRLGDQTTLSRILRQGLTTDIFLVGCLVMVGIYHLILFLVFRRNKSTLHFGLLCLVFALRTLLTGEYYLVQLLPGLPNWLSMRMEFGTVYVAPWLVVLFLGQLFPREIPKWLIKTMGIFSLIFCLSTVIPDGYWYSVILPYSYINIVFPGIYVIGYALPKAILQKRNSAPLFFSAILVLFGVTINDILYVRYVINTGFITPYGMIYFVFIKAMALAVRFGRTFHALHSLKDELKEKVENRAQELHQKNRDLETQKQSLFSKTEHLTASMEYAQSLQLAAQAPVEDLQQLFSEAFILFIPRDLVSGDFYWFGQVGDYQVVAVADCTGHGVPGAFMTAMGRALLDQIFLEEKETDPAKVLERLEKKVNSTLQSQVDGYRITDGMDIGIVVVDEQKQQIHFAGAKMDLIRIHKMSLERIKGGRHTIGGEALYGNKEFSKVTLPWVPGDRFYLFSDGFQDQFGGPKHRKYYSARFRTLLMQTAPGNLNHQQRRLESSFNKWKEDTPQTDDVLVVGFQI
ncbi:MAG: 7TM diverse intracellular signaling domain-containing protein [Bacteroidota bacterium]